MRSKRFLVALVLAGLVLGVPAAWAAQRSLQNRTKITESTAEDCLIVDQTGAGPVVDLRVSGTTVFEVENDGTVNAQANDFKTTGAFTNGTESMTAAEGEAAYDHTEGDGSGHADVATNSTHTEGDGSGHADVATNTAHGGLTNDPHSVTKAQVGLPSVLDILHKIDATQAPTVNNDVDEGYSAGSTWTDVTNDKSYVCVDAGDGVADWVEVGAGGGGASQLSDLSDVGVTTPTDKYALLGDGDSWESRALVEADISDMDHDAAKIDGIDLPVGAPADDQMMRYDSSSGDWAYEDVPGAAGGETNTMSNVGTDGVGVWYQKAGVGFEMRHIAPASSKITVVLNGQDIDIDLNITGTSFPGSPAEGDLFYHTTHDILFQYDGSSWIPLVGYSTTALYADDGAGSDAIGKGFGSGANATATIQYAIDNCLPQIVLGAFTINIAGGTYTEDVVLSRDVRGSGSITIVGETTSVDTGTADADSTNALLEDDGQGWAGSVHAERLVRITAGTGNGIDNDRWIEDNDADTLIIAGKFTEPLDNTSVFTIDTLDTIISPTTTGLLISNTQGVTIKYIKFNVAANGLFLSAGSEVTTYSCHFDTQTSTGLTVQASAIATKIIACYFDSVEKRGLWIRTHATATLYGNWFYNCNTDGTISAAAMKVSENAIVTSMRYNLFDGNDIADADAWGLYVTSGSQVAMITAATQDSEFINFSQAGCYGIYTNYGAVTIGAAGQVFGGGGESNDTDEAQTGVLVTIDVPMDPGTQYDIDTDVRLIELGLEVPNGFKITRWSVDFGMDPDVELDADLCYADDWAETGETVIDALDTTNGFSSETNPANINGGVAIPTGKRIYIRINADPEGDGDQMSFRMQGYAEED